MPKVYQKCFTFATTFPKKSQIYNISVILWLLLLKSERATAIHVSEKLGKTEVNDELMRDFEANLCSSIVVYDGDTPEIAELKGIVAGMKEDAQRYLSMSNGMRRLAIWLEERQLMEQGYRESFLVRVKKGEMKAEDVNDMFRAMGMRMIGE